MAQQPGSTHNNPRLSRRARRWLLVLAGLLLTWLGTLVWLLWPFWQLAGQFGSNPQKQPSRLYGRSPVLSTGAALGARQLRTLLGQAGYRQLDPQTSPRPGSWAEQGESFEIMRRSFPTLDGQSGRGRLRVTLAGGRVRQLQVDGRETRQALLDPPLIASYYGPDLRERRPVGIDELPEDLILCVLAAEDASFLSHAGVSITGTLRALWVNLNNKELRQGGSTLTQQLVKNLYLTPRRTLGRKIQEVVLAVALEVRYSKRAILETYLNEIYWGRSGSVDLMGVGAAAWAYFGKHVTELDLAESALLAGIIRAPAAYSPWKHSEEASQRRQFVLERLDELRWVEREKLERANRQPLGVQEHKLVARSAPYFAEAMAAEAKRRFAIEELRDAGYVLLSTLDEGDQEAAEKAVRQGLAALEKSWEKKKRKGEPLQAALVSIDPRDGSLLAYVGGRDYGTSQFDRLVLGRRQAGSAFKPIVYAAALETRVATPATLLEDAPFEIQLASTTWSPSNSDGKYEGWVSVRSALERSLNVPTARLALQVGMEKVVELAHRMGIATRLDPYPALALGAMEVPPLELATVYSTLAAGGKRPSLHGLAGVFDRAGQRVAGQPVPAPQPVLSPEVAYLTNHLLQGVLDRGTAQSAREQGLGDALAGKTGTTNSRRDSWFAGYSPDRATLVWVGYDDNAKTQLSGTRAAVPIWTSFALAVRPAGGYADFERPEGVVEALVDPTTGQLATTACPMMVTELFLHDAVPVEVCDAHGGWRAFPVEQPEGIEAPQPPRLKRWLNRILGRKKPPG